MLDRLNRPDAVGPGPEPGADVTSYADDLEPEGELVDLEHGGSPVVDRILVRRRRDVLSSEPDARAGRVDLSEGGVTPAGRDEGRRVRETVVRAVPGGDRDDPVGAEDRVGRARVDRLAGDGEHRYRRAELRRPDRRVEQVGAAGGDVTLLGDGTRTDVDAEP